MIAGAAAAQVVKEQMERAAHAEPGRRPEPDGPRGRRARARVVIASRLRSLAARVERPVSAA